MTEKVTELERRNDALEERIARLSAATLRINSSLDLDKVLQEVVDSARALTGARLGIITTVDVQGEVEEFVTSGFTSDEAEELATWSDGIVIFEHLRDMEEPLRVSNFRAYVDQLGLPSEKIKSETFQGTPLRHRGEHVGIFFLAGKDGGREFTEDDEDVLGLFASQAGTAIANARTYRNEQRAKADLQTLIEISPVGVVVFDGITGEPFSFNREARRIAEALHSPGDPPEDLLKLVNCRRADGRDVSLAEFPMARLLSNPEDIHAEEITLSVPDGRNVTVLCNSTPVKSIDGSTQSLVVTLQDLAPLEELTRLRAEFLGKVSDELRAPLVAIKGSSASVLGATPRPDSAEMLQYFRVIDDRADEMRGLIADLLEYGKIATGTLELSPVSIRVSNLIEQGCEQFRNEFKIQSLNIDVSANLPQVYVDPARIKQIIDILLRVTANFSQPLDVVEFNAKQEETHIAIRLNAPNWHIPQAQLPRLFQRYSLPTGDEDDDSSHHARIDLAICRGLIEANGGRIWAESDPAIGGTQITLTLPVAHDVSTVGVATPDSKSKTDSLISTQVLVINATPSMHRYIQESLTTPEFETFFVEDDDQLLDHFDAINPSLVILNLQQHGFAPREKITEISGLSDAPVIFIAHYGTDDTVVKALGAGAVDYLVHPFSRSELIARVRGALRRQGTSTPFVLNELQINYEERKVVVAEEHVELTATEYELLRVLSMNAGRVMNYNMLLRQVWGKRNTSPDDPKAVRAVVKRLRNKLGDDATTPKYVCNERGVGYFIPRPNDS